MRVIDFIAGSFVAQLLMTVAVYTLYAGIIGVSLVPSVCFIMFGIKRFLAQPVMIHEVFLFCFILGLSLFLYFITGILVMGAAIRALSLGMKPGKYPQASLHMLRWLIYSGIYHIAGSTILAFIPMTFFTNLFFRIIGAKIGKNVFINTWFLNDAYLLEIGDNVVIGGKSDISCHTFENNCLVLSPIKIGEGTLIGTRCYISPGVTIGKRCVVGMYSFIRRNRVIADHTFISSVEGMAARDIAVIENIRSRLDKIKSSAADARQSSLRESGE